MYKECSRIISRNDFMSQCKSLEESADFNQNNETKIKTDSTARGKLTRTNSIHIYESKCFCQPPSQYPPQKNTDCMRRGTSKIVSRNDFISQRKQLEGDADSDQMESKSNQNNEIKTKTNDIAREKLARTNSMHVYESNRFYSVPSPIMPKTSPNREDGAQTRQELKLLFPPDFETPKAALPQSQPANQSCITPFVYVIHSRIAFRATPYSQTGIPAVKFSPSREEALSNNSSR